MTGIVRSKRAYALVLGLVVLPLLAGSVARSAQDGPDDERRALCEEQLLIATRLLETIEAAPDAHPARDQIDAITRVRDCRLRLAGLREAKVEACTWCVEQLQRVADRTAKLVEVGRESPAAAIAVRYEVNEARIRLLDVKHPR